MHLTACNLKCSYCNPTVSSKWLEEVKQHGGYKTSTEFNDYIKPNEPLPFILDKDYNPYVEAFWKWLPDAYPHMHVLRVTGGEPLMSKHTFLIGLKTQMNPMLRKCVLLLTVT